MSTQKKYLSRSPRKTKKLPRVALIVIGILLVYCAWTLLRPLTPPTFSLLYQNQKISGTLPDSFALPENNTKIALATVENGQTFANSNSDKKTPTASTIKLLTALVVAEKWAGEDLSKKNIILGQTDVDFYKKTFEQSGSSIAVFAGETLSARDAIAAMLLPSANNMAYSLAVLSYGSVEKFVEAMNKKARELGMNDTVITDPSGLDPATVSTAKNMILLLKAVEKNDDIVSAMSTKSATFPGVGLIENTAARTLGQSGIFAGKTGTTVESGGCFAFIAEAPNGKKIIGVILGAGYVSQTAQALAIETLSSFTEFIKQAPKTSVPIVLQDAPIGEFRAPWLEKPVPVLSPTTIMQTKNAFDTSEVAVRSLSALITKNTTTIAIRFSSTNTDSPENAIRIEEKTPSPSILWRLVNPF